MAETRPTAGTTSVKATSVQPKKSGNAISWLAPLVCVLAGYVIWRFLMGNPSGFAAPDAGGGFWPGHKMHSTGSTKVVSSCLC
jgi:biopolymer transport protein ExbB